MECRMMILSSLQSDHALTLDYVESFGRRAQTGEKRSQCFSETQIGSAVGRLVCDRFQLGAGRVLAPTQLGHAVAQLIERKKVFLVGGEEARDAFLQTSEIAPKPILATLCTYYTDYMARYQQRTYDL